MNKKRNVAQKLSRNIKQKGSRQKTSKSIIAQNNSYLR